ncbi:MAG: dihydrodipicolinate synthase family protein [Anaerolineales bacterium]|nr:dihydrodipicolinate synthase family protein [Anaerolineales bacterium]
MHTERPPLRGILPPIPTPFQSEGELALESLHSNLERWNELPLSGYVVGGSNGEFVLLTHEERVAVVEAARARVPRDRWLVAGAGTQSTAGTIELSRKMIRAGAEALLVVNPHYYRRQMTPAALETHYRTVADAVKAPVLLYNVPANTGLDIPLDSVLRLAEHPNIVGIKDSGGDVTRLGAIREGTPEDFIVLAGSAGFLLGALAVGAVGAVSALANLAGHQLAELQARFEAGDMQGAKEIQLNLIEPNRAVTARYGIAGLKAGLDMLGYYGGPVRGPLQPLSAAERDDLRAILAAADLLP